MAVACSGPPDNGAVGPHASGPALVLEPAAVAVSELVLSFIDLFCLFGKFGSESDDSRFESVDFSRRVAGVDAKSVEVAE